jgi:hypothetical protein
VRKSHVRFLGEGIEVTLEPYPTKDSRSNAKSSRFKRAPGDGYRDDFLYPSRQTFQPLIFMGWVFPLLITIPKQHQPCH